MNLKWCESNGTGKAVNTQVAALFVNQAMPLSIPQLPLSCRNSLATIGNQMTLCWWGCWMAYIRIDVLAANDQLSFAVQPGRLLPVSTDFPLVRCGWKIGVSLQSRDHRDVTSSFQKWTWGGFATWRYHLGRVKKVTTPTELPKGKRYSVFDHLMESHHWDANSARPGDAGAVAPFGHMFIYVYNVDPISVDLPSMQGLPSTTEKPGALLSVIGLHLWCCWVPCHG